ncbi:MAG: hypothetical protein C0491_11230 [Novosphingobium sp.]|nr:hypothetical protein [Novosphingobium sp.]
MIFQPKRGALAGAAVGTVWAIFFSIIQMLGDSTSERWSRVIESTIWITIAFAIVGTFTNWLKDVDYM